MNTLFKLRTTWPRFKVTPCTFLILVYRSADGSRPQSGTTQISTLRIKSETGEMVIRLSVRSTRLSYLRTNSQEKGSRVNCCLL